MGQEAIAFNDDILGSDGVTAKGPVKVSSTKPLPVAVTGAGDATAANQVTIIARLETLDGRVDGIEALITSTNTKLDTIINDTSAAAVYGRPAEYETVAASQTDQMMGASGAVGDTIEGILVIPATTSPGAISIEDGATNTTVFAGGASSVSNLVPFWIELRNIASVSGGWEITTGANVSCLVFGQFT